MRRRTTSQWRATVLVVDDDPTSALHLGELVEEAGHRAYVANTWVDALLAFRRGPVDLVLMDAIMPGVDGFKLTKVIRSRVKSFVPIVFVTGLEDLRTRELCFRSGADDLITKPVDAFELGLRLTAMLRIRRLALDLEAEGEAMEALANLDPLTGLENRRRFETRLASELVRSSRYGHPLSLLVLDADHFKKINDSFGHAVGDEVLQRMGKVLRDNVQSPEAAYRYGGEEFVVLAPDSDLDRARVIGERVRGAFMAATERCEAGAQTLSVGVACTAQLGDPDAGLLFATADRALYLAKQGGRNRVRVFQGDRQRLMAA